MNGGEEHFIERAYQMVSMEDNTFVPKALGLYDVSIRFEDCECRQLIMRSDRTEHGSHKRILLDLVHSSHHGRVLHQVPRQEHGLERLSRPPADEFEQTHRDRAWMKVEPPHVTAESITYDIVEYLATFGGYTIGRTLDVCDSELYYAHVGCGLLNIEGDLQECINRLPPGQYLATTATLANARRIPLRLKRLNRSRLGFSFRLAFA